MFSQIPPSYEAMLQEELWGCHEFLNISYEELSKMPTRLRRFRVQRHNKYVEQQKSNMDGSESLTADNFRGSEF